MRWETSKGAACLSTKMIFFSTVDLELVCYFKEVCYSHRDIFSLKEANSGILY